MCPPHPEIKRIMQEQIGQYWADHAPLRSSPRPLNELPILFHGHRQPSFDVEQRPFASHVSPDCLQQKIMRKIVKQPFDVELQDPIIFPAPLTRDAYGVQSRFSRPV